MDKIKRLLSIVAAVVLACLLACNINAYADCRGC